MNKINKITTNGNNNIILQDVNAKNITINLNDNKAIEQFIANYSGSIDEILSILNQKQEPALQQFAEKIINIKNIQNANFNAQKGHIKIDKVDNVVIKKGEENRISRYVKYILLGFVLPASFLFLLYWHFVLSKPFSMTVRVNETQLVQSLPFKQGSISLQYGDKKEVKTIRDEVIFKQIPANLKGKTAKLHFEAQGYISIDTIIKLQNIFALPIKRNNDLGIITGMVKDEDNNPIKNVTITVKQIETQTDETGKFILKIPFEQQAEQQRLTAFKEGYKLWDETIPVIKGTETKIILRKK